MKKQLYKIVVCLVIILALISIKTLTYADVGSFERYDSGGGSFDFDFGGSDYDYDSDYSYSGGSLGGRIRGIGSIYNSYGYNISS